jgi:hypothetical protein
MKRGEKVRVETFDQKIIEGRLVEVLGETAIICSEKEWQAAARQHREPDCIGWPLGSVKIVDRVSL